MSITVEAVPSLIPVGSKRSPIQIGNQSCHVRRARGEFARSHGPAELALFPATNIESLPDRGWDPQPDEQPLVPHPTQWAKGITRIIFECIMGRRDYSTVRQWIHPYVLRRLEALNRDWDKAEIKRAGGLMKVGPINLCLPRPGIVEISTTVTMAQKIHAVAIRMEIIRRRWVVTAVETR
ncbi:Rv3235 family protein [Boudabousia marimammalium]|uniref:Uncharacterized protein n=1 Tax=Boudabousia marimammalium TaxID=156892 RepID=A0A1Q5PRL7_9ACTO|nr:Rv3235 family protein [Boudabousia marimammalium]OKL50196.1 hypothetical protein BM477_02035 [Boudabousia marimammalium]